MIEAPVIIACAKYEPFSYKRAVVMKEFVQFFKPRTLLGKEVRDAFSHPATNITTTISLEDLQQSLRTQYGRKTGAKRATLLSLEKAPPDHPIIISLRWEGGSFGEELYATTEIALEPLLSTVREAALTSLYLRTSERERQPITEIIRRQEYYGRLEQLFGNDATFIRSEMKKQQDAAADLVMQRHREVQRMTNQYITATARTLGWVVEDALRVIRHERTETPHTSIGMNVNSETVAWHPIKPQEWITLTDHNVDPNHTYRLGGEAGIIYEQASNTVLQTQGIRANNN